MKLVIYHPQGNTNVRESARSFAEANLLREYHTSVACFPSSFLDSLANLPYVSELRRRKLDLALKPFTRTAPFREICRLISQKAGFSKLIKTETGLFSVEAITRELDKKVAKNLHKVLTKHDGVYAYEDGAYFSFQEAKRRGSQCFYDLPTGYWRAKVSILEEQKKKFPDWKYTMPALTDSKEKLKNKDEELKLADCIFVASNFTKYTLQQFPGTLANIHVIPYGFPPVASAKNYERKSYSPIKLLFVGSLSQQKGIANLFEAVNEIGPEVKLTVIGQKSTSDCMVLNSELLKHRWIPSLPHHKILEEMRAHDVLIFPTLFDGFGLVVSESMSQGTPVIATHNCAGPDLIEHGKNGWLVTPGSTSMLKTMIEDVIQNPHLISKVGQAAMVTARNRPWSVFRKELSDAIKTHYLMYSIIP